MGKAHRGKVMMFMDDVIRKEREFKPRLEITVLYFNRGKAVTVKPEITGMPDVHINTQTLYEGDIWRFNLEKLCQVINERNANG